MTLTPEERDEYTSDEDKLEELFHEQMRKTVESWVEWADAKLEGSKIQCIVCPGNDDREDIDEILATVQAHHRSARATCSTFPRGISWPRAAGPT